LLDDERRTAMGDAARRLGTPDAATVLATELLALVEGPPTSSAAS
jgi:UDP-N-acetylglucosamine:LPS N-acetylglucosamine transferase